MKYRSMAVSLFALVALSGSLAVAAQDASPVNFTVTIQNVSGMNTSIYADVGIVGVPVGATARAAITPGQSYEFTVKAAPGDHLSFATMYGQSNDSFLGPDENGIALFDASGNPVSGDVSDQIKVWDAGTEVNEPLGKGPNQGPRQANPDAGTPENGSVEVVNDPAEFSPISALMKVTLTPVDAHRITVRIDNISANAIVPTPFSPLVYVIHSAAQTAPLFTTGQPDRGLGLERIAENGNPEILAAAVAGSAVKDVGLSPGTFVIYNGDQTAPYFTTGQADRGQGLEAQAEDGNPATLGQTLMGMSNFKQVGIFNTAVNGTKAGPLKPGQMFQIQFSATPGDRFSFTEMFGQSNDLFFSPDENGIALFSPNGSPVSGTFSGAIQLWDAGTEVNQEPFVGPDQAARQAAPNTGADEHGTVRPINQVEDGFTYPSALSAIKVTIANDAGAAEMNMMAPGMMMTPDAMAMTPEATMGMMMTPEATPNS